jgi:CheY-like chemotaxis protein
MPLPAAPQGRRVLVVDDNRDAAQTLAELVSLLGHTAVTAYDGPQAMRRAAAFDPEVVLCDIGLPGMSGFEVAQALRERLGPQVRLYALSGYARSEDIAQARQAGFDDHLSKPADPERIARLLAAD